MYDVRATTKNKSLQLVEPSLEAKQRLSIQSQSLPSQLGLKGFHPAIPSSSSSNKFFCPRPCACAC
jgi:hypothetical protein